MQEDKYRSPIVFVLGAGFTRSFDSQAPLLECDINIPYLLRKYKGFKEASRILEYVVNDKNLVNIETLMSRLYSGMPYDDDFLQNGQRQILYSDVKDLFLKQILSIKCESQKCLTLDNFARYVLKNKASCISFNYDELLDKTLFNSSLGNVLDGITSKDTAWTPMQGYGFYIDSALSLTGNQISSFTKSTSLLLKMHGSINWFPKRGYKDPYPMNAIVHMQDWWPIKESPDIDILYHYEHSPVVIPPVYDKNSLTGQPILRVIWSKAFELLREAETVIFIGYSLPSTDFVGSYLFRESLFKKSNKNIQIVSKGTSKENSEELKRRYKTILAQFTSKNFEFVDAAEWIDHNLV